MIWGLIELMSSIMVLMCISVMFVIAMMMAYFAITEALRSEWLRRFIVRVVKGVGKVAKRVFKCSKD